MRYQPKGRASREDRNSGRGSRPAFRERADFGNEWDETGEDFEEQPNAEKGAFDENGESRPYKPGRKTSAATGRNRRSSAAGTVVRERARKNYRSTSAASFSRQSTVAKRKASTSSKSRRKRNAPRGFAAMPKSEVRRIASMGGRASHGGGRPPGSKTKSKKNRRSR